MSGRSLSILAACGITLIAAWGPLDPPDGPITPSYKTLTEVEPRIAVSAQNTPGDINSIFKITKPGSYYLTGNITGVSGKSGIEVTANCTIDLCGFELAGVNGSLDGILLVDEFRGTVRNGQVVNWGRNGIAGVQCNSSLFEDLYIQNNGAAGLNAGRDSVISRVRSATNKTHGILVEAYCTIIDCVASGNTLSGIAAGSFSTVTRCNTRGNLEHGISALVGANISECVAQGNTSAGIRASSGLVRDNVCESNGDYNICIAGEGGATVRGNTCNNSAGAGIYCLAGRNRIENNLLKSNAWGLRFQEFGFSLAIGNYAWGNTTGAFDFPTGNHYGERIYQPGEFSAASAWGNVYSN